MAAPNVKIQVYSFGLMVQLKALDLPDSTPSVSWAWTLVDATPNSSVTQAPIINYATAGTYTVEVEATNADGTTTVTLEIEVTESDAITIQDALSIELPTALFVDENKKNTRIKYWRLYLQNLVTPNIPDANIFDDSYWDSLVNVLIAKLVARDMIMQEAKNALLSAFGADSLNENLGGNSPIKMIETGQAKSEWFNGSAAIKNIFAANALGKTPFMELTEDICTLSKRLRIYLPFCGQLGGLVILPKVLKNDPPDDAITILNKYYSK